MLANCFFSANMTSPQKDSPLSSFNVRALQFQNYVTMSGVRYVDLGLGTHRVKCRIHTNFRLVLIAEDKDVYEKFPIPLINRLEKHYLGMETMLTEGKPKSFT